MHMQDQQEQADETCGKVVELSDLLVAEIVAVLKRHLQDDLPQLRSDPWTADQRGKDLYFGL